MTKIYMPPSVRSFAPRHQVFSTWKDHLPFGYDLVAAMRPRMLVELGTHKGSSYFTFCQAMQENRIDGLCYAVDTFQGDAHTGSYEESVFKDVVSYNRETYNGFSYIMRMSFKDALQHFSEDSLCLLHIDGLHTYEAVSEDFRDWFPKVRAGGIVLFHDVQARREDFGVWKFWEEIRGQHETFTFNHGFGLGVLRKPGGNREDDAELLGLLFDDPSDEAHSRLRAFYVHASQHLQNLRRSGRAEQRRRRRPPPGQHRERKTDASLD